MTTPDDRGRPVGAEPAPQVEPAHAAPAAPAAAQPPVGWLPRPAVELFGDGATAEEAYGLLTVDVPADAWLPALEIARDVLGCTYFDWLSAVDEPGEGFRVAAHVVALGPAPAAAEPGASAAGGPGAPAVRGLLVRTTVAHDAPALPTATGVYAGAAWHERETHEMFGIDFTGHPHLVPLLLPDGFEGHPLRKDFVLAARVVKAWPGAKEPGESEAAHGPRRRQMLPPGVPDPNEWGPLKGQLPAAPARPARATRAAGAAGERPARRARSATAGSASQRAATDAEAAGGAPGDAPTAPTAPTASAAPARPPRRSRSVSEGSASQRDTSAEAADTAPEAPGGATRPARRSRSASEGSASRRAATGGQAPAGPERPAPRPRSTDAPWHHARPARDEPTAAPGAETPATSTDATSTDGTSTDDTSTDGTSTDGTSTDGTSTDGTSTDATSTDATSTDATSTDATSTDATSTDATSTDATSTDATSTDDTAGGTA
ncbi:NADH-quinone oxidoreductase subunit C [Streptomyces sparsogenes]|uniref:NADH-quinone oxidoreductase subunit C n=1 Tax=Streptomyces sparsogenes TaxID=67365 RepID=UPI003F4CB928